MLTLLLLLKLMTVSSNWSNLTSCSTRFLCITKAPCLWSERIEYLKRDQDTTFLSFIGKTLSIHLPNIVNLCNDQEGEDRPPPLLGADIDLVGCEVLVNKVDPHPNIYCRYQTHVTEGQRWPSCPCLTNAMLDSALQNDSLMPM